MRLTDTELRQIIEDEIIVDCYDEHEESSGWQCYMGDNLAVPFEAVCREKNARSPLNAGEQVTVLSMTEMDGKLDDIFVTVRWNDREFGVPLEQLQAIDPSGETQTAINAWTLWVKNGYSI